MTVIEEALRTVLTGNGTVSGLVGTRIYPLVLPQGVTLPAIAYQRISGVREHTHDKTGDLARPRFQWTCVATTYSSAKALANAVRAALDNYRATASTVVIEAIYVENEIDVFNESEDQGDSTYGVLVDATVWHHE